MNIKLLSASDRNNYGDLLFPIILNRIAIEVNESSKIDNYGIRKSNLTHFGALKTKSFKKLIQDIKNDSNSLVVIAGGEVLGSDWLNILRFLNKFWNRIHKSKYPKLFLKKYKILEKYFYKRFKSEYPFILNDISSKKVKIVYNSVGALGIKKFLWKKNLQNYFKNVEKLSVRDFYSQQIFKDYGIQSELIPDSAIIISDLFKDEMFKQISNEAYEISERKYLFIQLGKTKGPDDLGSFSRKLKRFSEKNSLEVVLCPIGMALDHEDEIILKKLADLDESYNFYKPKNLFEIMFLIKRSQLYMGTSLHGLITAQSFNIPFIAFPEKIQKIKIYIQTWFNSYEIMNCNFYDFKKIQKVFDQFPRSEVKKEVAYQKEIVYKNLYSFLK